MKFWAVLTTFLSTVAIVATFLTAPVEFSPNELNVKKNLTNYTGSFRAGFQKSSIFSYSNVKLYTFSPIENDETLLESDAQNKENPVVLFFPDKRADTHNYSPYLQLLAQKGFTVMYWLSFSTICLGVSPSIAIVFPFLFCNNVKM